MVKIDKGKLKIMKKKLLVSLTLVLTLAFMGCSKDENNSSTATIVGKWKTVKGEYYTNGLLVNEEIVVEDNSNCPDYLEFKSNGTYVSIFNDASCNSTTDEIGSYIFNGTTIIINSGGFTANYTVVSFTGNELKTEFTETSSDGTVYKDVIYRTKIN